jgi:hypothetical protein
MILKDMAKAPVLLRLHKIYHNKNKTPAPSPVQAFFTL